MWVCFLASRLPLVTPLGPPDIETDREPCRPEGQFYSQYIGVVFACRSTPLLLRPLLVYLFPTA